MRNPPEVIRPTALVLNVIVAAITSAQFFRAGHFQGSLFLPLVVSSVPAAALGGALRLPTAAFEMLVGLVLAASAIRLMRDAWPMTNAAGGPPDGAPAPSAPLLAALGGGIGLLSGLTGVGGGVFLTPVLLALHAAPVKRIAAVTAPFILVNSLAGLAGGMFAGRGLPVVSMAVVGAAMIGGAIGSQLGAFRLPAGTLRLLMAGVLAIASVKLLGL